MLTKTTLSAVRAITFLGLNRQNEPCSPRVMAQQLGESPSYLAKVTRHLVCAGILKAHRGVAGGVSFNRNPAEISLLMVVEACQGALLGDFCGDANDCSQTCAFHQAGAELHAAIVSVLSRWSVADFLNRPGPSPEIAARVQCSLAPCPRLQSPTIAVAETISRVSEAARPQEHRP